MVANYGNNTSHDGIQILLNNGSGVFTALTQYTSGMNEPDALAVGYFNGSGKPLDVAVANYGEQRDCRSRRQRQRQRHRLLLRHHLQQ